MARGYPDYNTPLNSVGSVSFDSAELAARLGSLSRIDRLGNVIFQDNFDSGLGAWFVSASGNSYVRCMLAPVFEGGGVMAIGTLAATNPTITVSKNIPIHTVSKIGLECVIGYDHNANAGIPLTFIFESYLQPLLKRYLVKIDPIADTVSVYHNALVGLDEYKVVVSGIGKFIPDINGVMYHHLKFVIDLENNRYDKLYFDRVSVGLTEYNPIAFSGMDFTGIVFSITKAVDTALNVVYIDNVIITINEP